MKLPPLALVAPSLCPRCDQPAMVLDRLDDQRCAHCGLQLHRCGSCHGVAGPFDRFCGFCGHELVRGEELGGFSPGQIVPLPTMWGGRVGTSDT